MTVRILEYKNMGIYYNVNKKVNNREKHLPKHQKKREKNQRQKLQII